MNDEAGFGGLVLSASSQNVSILIRALQETREMRVLSRPLVRTLDNQPAFIQVGQRVPRIVGSTVSTYGQSNSIANENVGLILGVTPRISPDGNVVMEIDAEKSKVGPEEEGIPVAVSMDGTIIRSPRVDTVTAQATVSVADGETVVLGGMISTEKEDVAAPRAVPVRSARVGPTVPLRLDRTSNARKCSSSSRPHVIRSQEDGERIKQAEFARMSWCAADVYDLYGDPGLNFQHERDGAVGRPQYGSHLSRPQSTRNTGGHPASPLRRTVPLPRTGSSGNVSARPAAATGSALPSGAGQPVLNPVLSQAPAGLG